MRRQRPRGGEGRAGQGRAGGQDDSQLSTCYAPGSTHESTCRRATSGRAAAGGRPGWAGVWAACSAVQRGAAQCRRLGAHIDRLAAPLAAGVVPFSVCSTWALLLSCLRLCAHAAHADTFDRVVPPSPPPGTAAAWGPACPRPLILPVLACPCCAGLPCRRLVVRLHAHQQKRTMPSSRHRWPPPRPCPSMPIHTHAR